MNFKRISSAEAKEIIDNEPVTILDVRTKAEYESGHIENALLIPKDDIEDTVEDLLPDKEAKILVYCRSGVRSKAVSRVLVEMGYTNIYEFGGILDWKYDIVISEM